MNISKRWARPRYFSSIVALVYVLGRLALAFGLASEALLKSVPRTDISLRDCKVGAGERHHTIPIS